MISKNLSPNNRSSTHKLNTQWRRDVIIGPTIQFDKQPHQDECIERIMEVLEDRGNHTLQLKPGHDFNCLFPKNPDVNKMDILMETGTGKTYIYLKAIFEIHKKFGKNKFVIIVPRMSIKLGVKQSIKQSANHFFSQYGRYLKCINYPEDGILGVLSGFLNADDLSVMLITNSAFNKDANLINKPHESLYGGTTVWKKIVKLAPVIIMDEPHLLAGTQTAKYLDELRSNSLVMRFGATYPDDENDGISNVVYTLDSISAFNQKLVKKIHTSVVDSRVENSGVHVIKTHGRRKFTVGYTVNGQHRTTDVRLTDDLGAATGLSVYHNRHATSIHSNEVILNDGMRLPVSGYVLTDDEIREMVRETIDMHFEHEKKMFLLGIKTLSLFFIPRIMDYRGGDERIKKIFEEEYIVARTKCLGENIDPEYRRYLDRDYDGDGTLSVHNGYFSGDQQKLNEKDEADGVSLILNDKQTLLSFTQPLRFIFTVWALQEGWDNPNVFNICKLSHTKKDNSRRQQVGRGLRVAVDQYGRRMTEKRLADDKRAAFHDVNKLTMVVPSYEHTFISDIQAEIHAASPSIMAESITLKSMGRLGLSAVEGSTIFLKLLEHGVITSEGERKSSVQNFLETHRDIFPNIEEKRLDEIIRLFQDTSSLVVDNRRQEKPVRIRQDKWKEFKELWESINRKASIVYKNIDEDEIIHIVSKEFNAARIPEARTTITRQEYDDKKDEIMIRMVETKAAADYFRNEKLHHSIIEISKEHGWPIRFLLGLFNSIDVRKFISNPEEAKRLLLKMIHNAVHSVVLEKVEYQFAKTTIYCNGLQDGNGNGRKTISPAKLGKYRADEIPRDEFLYDTTVYDSAIELDSIRESTVYRVGGKTRNVTVFAKLPRISIPTPLKTYNPDFAYVISGEKGESFFLAIETKGYDTEAEIPLDEKHKIEYGRKFFESLQKVLPKNVNVRFESRLSTDNMSEIVQRCYSG